MRAASPGMERSPPKRVYLSRPAAVAAQWALSTLTVSPQRDVRSARGEATQSTQFTPDADKKLVCSSISEYDEYLLGGAPEREKRIYLYDDLFQRLCLWVVAPVALWVFGNTVTFAIGPMVICFISYLLECLVARHPRCASGRQLRWGILLLLALITLSVLLMASNADWSFWSSGDLKAHYHFRMRRRLLELHRDHDVTQQAGCQLLSMGYGLIQSTHAFAVASSSSRTLALLFAAFGWVGLTSCLLALIILWRHRFLLRRLVKRHVTPHFLPAHFQCADCRR
ncbi:unnamed protein product [Vitrella brassicaformis CCMP3155]|uniref:Uncharacterized protein n=1 Tax=Vitrella brassicaformis (strain CCMP3155) TaxID=1169540 RepID=A0A0G4G6V0_VITBC|nr:unnamed protein product [Vitrella brassicaformis CCMP3155]|eukprot:CEM23936.1 unnamed protein product [Vitrella brassicaformis CCMP3155]